MKTTNFTNALFLYTFSLIEAILINMLALGHEAYANQSISKPLDVCPETTYNCASIYTLYWGGLNANDTVIIHGGTYKKPILIYNVPNGANIVSDGINDVVINNYVAFINSKNVTWNGQDRIHIQNTAYPGISIVQGSSNVAVMRTEIAATGLGIWIGQGAGCGHDIIGNTIRNNQTMGIATDKINCTAGNETIVSNNTIIGNLWHGIELHANYYIIESNEVAWNGTGLPGTSGIHVYAANPWEGTGQHNIIRYNSSHDNSDINGPDGNGIQLDQYTRFNVVSDNYVFNNNGYGIIAFDSSDDQIANNTVYNNMIDSLDSHPCCKANIVVTSASFFDSGKINYVNNVTVSNNTIISGNTNINPIFVDPVSAANNVTIKNNITP